MPQANSVSIVVPLYNEEGAVDELSSRLVSVLKASGRSWEIIFVDDGSKDKTREHVLAMRSSHPQISLVELSRNFGQTAALAAGIDSARGEIIITMDGDLQHRPEEIPKFLAKLDEGYDLVSGWREGRSDGMTRKLPSRCANWLMRALSGVSVKDFGSTFKAYRGEVLHRVELFGELHRFIPVLAHQAGARIVEIPIDVAPREKGVSNYGLRRTFGVFEDILFLYFYTHYLTRPIRAFGRLFFLFFGAGFAISAALMGLWALHIIEAVLQHGALLLFSVFLMISGIQFLVAGVIAELITRIYLNTRGAKIYSVRRIHESAF